MIIRRIFVIAVFGILVIFNLGVSVSKAAYINLAPDGTATANSFWNGGPSGPYVPPYTPDRAIDEDQGTQWNAGTHATSTTPFWLIVDLGNTYNIDKIVLLSQDLSIYSDYFNENYNLYKSMDGLNWDYIQSGILIDTPVLYRNEIIISAPTSFVKFEVAGGTHWAHLNEIEIWGDSNPVAEPTTMLLLGLGLMGLAGMRRFRN